MNPLYPDYIQQCDAAAGGRYWLKGLTCVGSVDGWDIYTGHNMIGAANPNVQNFYRGFPERSPEPYFDMWSFRGLLDPYNSGPVKQRLGCPDSVIQ